MIDAQLYVNKPIPIEWLPVDLVNIKHWTWGELAQDRTTHWTGPDGKLFVMARQLLHIWASMPPHKIADLPEDKQPDAIHLQQVALAMLTLFPSESKKKEPKQKKSKSKTAS